MKRFVNWLYLRFVYLPELKEQLQKEYGPGVTIKVTEWLEQDHIQIRQAEIERKWISDDELH